MFFYTEFIIESGDTMSKMFAVAFLLLVVGCTQTSAKPVPLTADDLLVIAHRGASTYAPDHTLVAYEMAVDMGADYIELDLQMTNDGKLVALHDSVISLRGVERAVADMTVDELQFYAPGMEFNEENPLYATFAYEDVRVPELGEILQHFGDQTKYYIEIKSPDSYLGIEDELIRQLRAHLSIGTSDMLPNVIIQSFDAASLKKVFQLEPSIPLIQLYRFDKVAWLSEKEFVDLQSYASGIGLNWEAVTKEFVDSVHREGLDVHPFTVNEETDMRNLLLLGVDGFITDKPDIAARLRDEESSMDID